ncbi:AAA family ATPase, partial [Paracoccus sp. (in: a-proteobacteria)]|uniref:nucleotide-binding protein n=1 Tax=Paracoccus sp. TaxID=267 RepID=UPI003A8B622E
MYTHEDLARLQAQSLKMQGWIRRQTFSPEHEKTLRRFSSWEVAELIFCINQSTFRGKLAADPNLPLGEVEEDGRQRWFSLDEINELRRRVRIGKRSLMPPRPAGKRAFRAAIANFTGGAGKSTVALHFAHAAALDGYRVLVVDFDPQATLSHYLCLSDVVDEQNVCGFMERDIARDTVRFTAASSGSERGTAMPHRKLPASIRDM